MKFKILTALAAISLMFVGAQAVTAQEVTGAAPGVQSAQANEEVPAKIPAGNKNAVPLELGKPKMVLEETSFDFGDVSPGSKVKHVFIVKNEGGAPLVIEDILPGCGCSVANFDRVIFPGKTGIVTISVHVYKEWAGQKFVKAAQMKTDDPLTPLTQLRVNGNVLPLQEPAPSKTN